LSKLEKQQQRKEKTRAKGPSESSKERSVPRKEDRSASSGAEGDVSHLAPRDERICGRKDELDPLITLPGGVALPPSQLRMMQEQSIDNTSLAYQGMNREALREMINEVLTLLLGRPAGDSVEVALVCSKNAASHEHKCHQEESTLVLNSFKTSYTSLKLTEDQGGSLLRKIIHGGDRDANKDQELTVVKGKKMMKDKISMECSGMYESEETTMSPCGIVVKIFFQELCKLNSRLKDEIP
ncbi:hypothetical protein U0070_025259, partial [Myodes glareolus]